MKVYEVKYYYTDVEDDDTRHDGIYASKELASAAKQLILAKHYKREMCVWVSSMKVRTKLKGSK